jgi:hypothetical protein
LGELIERLVSPNPLGKFNTLGYAFTKTNTRVKYKDTNTGKTLAEMDAPLENGDYALVVEDVKEHVKRMGTLKAYADAHNDKRGYLGGDSRKDSQRRCESLHVEKRLLRVGAVWRHDEHRHHSQSVEAQDMVKAWRHQIKNAVNSSRRITAS